MEYRDSNTLYALGMLYGKGDILFNSDGSSCKLIFEIKYRRPRTASLRSDNKRRDLTSEMLSPPVTVDVFNDFKDLSRIFTQSFGVRIDLEPLPNDVNSWNKKRIILESEDIKTDSKILKQLFDKDKIDNTTLQHVPMYLFDKKTSKQWVIAFLQGVCDAAGLPPSEASSAYGSNGPIRVQIELEWGRWYLPVEICRLFQRKLSIPIQMINWGHPNSRGTNSYRGQNHQFRIYAQDFKILDFRLRFKKTELDNLLSRVQSRSSVKGFYPKNITKKAKLPPYPCNKHNENDPDLPLELRGKHFERNYQIYDALKSSCYPLKTIEDNNYND